MLEPMTADDPIHMYIVTSVIGLSGSLQIYKGGKAELRRRRIGRDLEG